MMGGLLSGLTMRLSVLTAGVCLMILLWHECGENPAVFCYRIGHGFLQSARQRALVPAQVYGVAESPMRQRTHTACWKRSCTFSGHSTILKD